MGYGAAVRETAESRMAHQPKPKWLDYSRISRDCVCGKCEPAYGPPDCRYRESLPKIVVFMKTMPIASRMRLFGSAARGKPRPGDIDVMVDLDDPAWEGSVGGEWAIQKPMAADHAGALRQLLTMARHAYGCIDPFWRWNGVH